MQIGEFGDAATPNPASGDARCVCKYIFEFGKHIEWLSWCESALECSMGTSHIAATFESCAQKTMKVLVPRNSKGRELVTSARDCGPSLRRKHILFALPL